MTDTNAAEQISTEPIREIACATCGLVVDVTGRPPFSEVTCPSCHAVLVVPTRLGPFLLLGLINKGGMGMVYHALDESLNRPVAIKVMHAGLGADREFVETFRREAQAAAALNHPHIVQIYSFGAAHGQPYIVMELLSGGGLDRLIAQGRPLNEARILKIGLEVADALRAANDIGLMHGDIKPENILFDAAGAAKVVDFGLASYMDRQREAGAQGIWGTPYYIAPEKVRRQHADARADIYSLGATMFHALAGKPPFEGETPVDVVKARLTDPAPLLRSVRPDIRPEVESIIARMLEAEPARRYPTYASLVGDLRRTLDLIGPPPPEPALSPIGRRGGKIVVSKKSRLSASSRNLLGDLVAAGDATSTHKPVTSGRDEMERPAGRAGTRRMAVAVGLAVVAALGLWLGVRQFRAMRERQAAAAEEAAALRASQVEAAKWRSALALWAADATNRVAQLGPRRKAAAEAAASCRASVAMSPELAVLAESAVQVQARADAGEQDWVTAVAAAQAVQELAQAADPLFEAVKAATNAATAQTAFDEAMARVAEADATADAIENLTASADKNWQETLRLSAEFVRAADARLTEARRRAEEAAAAARKAAEEAEARRRAEEQAALAVKEIERLKALREANLALVRINQFGEASRALAAAEGELQTEEGRRAAAAMGRRYAQLETLKKLVIAGINADARASPQGFEFGWLVQGVPSRDVLGADAERILLRGGTASWDQVSAAQMIRFIKRYVPDAKAPRRERAAQLLAVAVYYYEVGGGAERAVREAAEYAAEAARLDSSLQNAIREMMPEVASR